MQRRMFLSKIHRAVITHADLHYEGSCTIDVSLMEVADILPHQEVHIWNITRGTRIVAYALPGPRGSGVLCINGAAAHGNVPGDLAIIATFGNLDFEGNKIWHGYFHNGFMELPNYYSVYWGAAYNPTTVSNRRTRGGPLTSTPPGRELWIGVDSDSRKSLVLSLFVSSYARKDEPSVYLESSLQWKPAPNLTFSAGPSFSTSTTFAQWVGSYDDATATATYGKRYVFATLDQTSLSANIRLNWTFTPKLSLQLFAQPLLSAGEYTEIKALGQVRTFKRASVFVLLCVSALAGLGAAWGRSVRRN